MGSEIVTLTYYYFQASDSVLHLNMIYFETWCGTYMECNVNI